MTRLASGKIPVDILNRTVLGMRGRQSSDVLQGPEAGLDFGVVKLRKGFLVVSADPITGISEEVGRYAVKVSANDVATSGNRPQFAESVVLLPEGSSSSDLKKIALQIHEAAVDSGIAILGGHTEVTPGLRRPIVVITVFSVVDSYVTSGGAKDGDSILMTKTAGIEGTAELAKERKFGPGAISLSTLRSARGLIEKIDIADEAVAAYGTGHVHAMHDCTEGGVVGAVFEMSLASGLGFVLDEASVPVAPETREICGELSVDPLRLIGSGSLLIAVQEGKEDEVEKALRPLCRVTKVGRFREGRRVVQSRSGATQLLKEAPQDELWRVLGRPARRRHRL